MNRLRERLRSARVRRWLWMGAASLPLALAGGAAGLVALWVCLPLVPLPESLFARPEPPLEFVDRQDRPLRTVLPGGGPFRHRVAYGEIPLPLVQATLAAEDRRFWDHPGVDWKASLRAAWQLAAHRRVISGGSTITQQLIKLAQPRPRTFRNKLIEAVQALRLEQVWDKQRILSEYLNRIEYGNFNTGCAAAARFYFAKPLRDLDTAECALLAGLPQAPSRLNPHAHFQRALKRQRWILERMARCGWLDRNALARASEERLCLPKAPRAFEAPHFLELAMRLEPAILRAPAQTPHTALAGRSRRVRTTLDLDLNHFAEDTLRDHLARLASKRVHNGAIVILDNRSGHVLALVGSEDYFSPDAGQVNGAWAPRSAGSTFKPFTYLLAFETGASPATIAADVPAEFPTATGLFAPVNYDRHCYGPMRYRVALANSLNIPAVRVLASVGGPEALRGKLQACGLSTLTQPAEFYGLGLTIGNAEARLLELANAYACLARLGQFKPCVLIEAAGQSSTPPRAGRRVADADAAWLIADILSDNAARAIAFGADSPLRFAFPVACKTGTSTDFRDNWAFGYTPEFTVGVWVGNFDGSPMRNVSGVSGAAPILHSLFEHLHASYGTTWFATPANIASAPVHPLTGKRLVPRRNSPRPSAESVIEKFIAHTPPPLESAADYDEAGRVRLGPEYRDWLATADNWLAGRAVLAAGQPGVRIVFPPPGTTLFLDPDLPHNGSRLPLRADGPSVQWSSDTLECRREGTGQIALLTPGQHRLTARDPQTGAASQTWISVSAR